MANAKRPSIPSDATPIPPAITEPNPKYQVHNNMAPFSPAPVKNATDGGSHSNSKLSGGVLNEEEEGTGRW